MPSVSIRPLWQNPLRRMLRTWSATGWLPGYQYQIMQRWGARLSDGDSVSATLPNGCVMQCDLRDEVQRQIYFLGAYEPIEAFLFSHLLQPGMTVVDAGANVGQFSLLASTAVGPAGQVHSFEPIPANMHKLSDHVRTNACDNVVLNAAALWHEAAELSLGSLEHLENAGTFSVGLCNQGPAVSANAVTLDQYAAERKLIQLDMIKMDIEGAEWFALRGARHTLTKFAPLILLEVCQTTCERLDYDTSEIFDLLKSLGYRAWRIGQSCEETRELDNLHGIQQANVIFAVSQPNWPKSWDLKSCLKWAHSSANPAISPRLLPRNAA